MEKNRILAVGLIGVLLAVGLAVVGCSDPGEGCSGNGKCTVYIDQGTNGLYINDTDYARSTCGEGAKWDSDMQDYSGGCEVQNNINNIKQKYGKHGCDC